MVEEGCFRRNLYCRLATFPIPCRRGEIFARCAVISERADAAGAFFQVRGEAAVLENLRTLARA